MPGWKPADATDNIRAIARSASLDISYKRHATDQISDRGLIASDVLYVLENGFVYNNPEEATRAGFYKYAMEGLTPNSGSRSVRVIVIPDEGRRHLKIITVMWVDEK